MTTAGSYETRASSTCGANSDAAHARSVGAMKHTGSVYTVRPGRLHKDIPLLLDAAGLGRAVKDRPRILIKPNLVEALPPPITTPVDIIEILIDYLQAATDAELVIGEGTGSLEYDTWRPFEELGYTEMAKRKGVSLVDLNSEECVELSDARCRRWPVMFLPSVALESFLISVPVLKAHTLAGVTLTMKNMMGLAPPRHYQQGGAWKKSSFHTEIHEAVADLNRYRAPDFTLLDAREGMAEAHLYGPKCDPPPGTVAASFDPVAADAWGTGLLGVNWRDIGHISMLNGELGRADPLDVAELGPAR